MEEQVGLDKGIHSLNSLGSLKIPSQREEKLTKMTIKD